jgi:hypothetical protein
MNHQEQLHAAMKAHEHLAPEPTEVYARVQELAKTYRRRRLIAQSAGGAVLGVAAIVGAFQLPGLIPGDTAPSGGVTIVQPAGPAPSPAVPGHSAVPSSAVPGFSAGEDPEFTPAERKAREKYFASGYGLDEAEKLSKLWKNDDITAVKTLAGQRLLDGRKLPVQPPEQAVEDARDSERARAFFAEGYDVDDAAKLAELWRLPSPHDAKVEGGKRIMAGESLPFRP